MKILRPFDDISFHEGLVVYLDNKGIADLVNHCKFPGAAEFKEYFKVEFPEVADEIQKEGEEMSRREDQTSSVWRFKGQKVKIKVDSNGKEWFCGKDVCEILGLQNPNIALLKQVKKAYKTNLKFLEETCTGHATPNTYNSGKAV